MFNLHTQIVTNPTHYKQLSCGDSLITKYDCELQNKFEDIWSHHSYIVFVVEGRKIWHTPNGSFNMKKGSCMLVRKGASIVEQFFDSKFCLILFFIRDQFICEVLKTKERKIKTYNHNYLPVIPIQVDESMLNFYSSMLSYFTLKQKPDVTILELKFRELILTIADNNENEELISFFCDLIKSPQNISLQKVMEENFTFNLKLEGFAELCSRSLSAFKRDFGNYYNTTPAKWLLEKRLNHAHHLLLHEGKTVAEASFESGFENLSHFSRSFKQRFGIAAAALKNNN